MRTRYWGSSREWRALPRPAITVPLLVLAFAVCVFADFAVAPYNYSDLRAVLLLVIPYSPLLALTLGPLPGAVAWFLAAAITLASQDESQTVMALLFPLIPVAAFCTYLLPWRSAIVLTAAFFAVLPIIGIRHHAAGAYLIGVFLAAAVAAGLGLNVMRQRNEKVQKELDEARDHEADIRAQERKHLARELHDIVAHDITVIAMHANRAEFLANPAQVTQLLGTISVSARQTLQDLRNLVVVLNEDREAADEEPPEIAPDDATPAAFAAEVDGVVGALRDAIFTIDLEIDGALQRIPSSLIPALRRTVRELGTNIMKHGDPAGRARMRITIDDEELVLSAENTVLKHDTMPSSLTGLEAMRERALLLGGTVDFGAVGGFWTSKMTLPLSGARKQERRNDDPSVVGRR